MVEQPAFLYIEDHPASRRVFELILTKIAGYEDLTIFDHTGDLLERLRETDKSFDVIFLDLNMKPLDGFETCHLLRDHEQYQKARIIGLSANISPAIIRKMQDSGFDGAISKPINHESFAEKLNQILKNGVLWNNFDD